MEDAVYHGCITHHGHFSVLCIFILFGVLASITESKWSLFAAPKGQRIVTNRFKTSHKLLLLHKVLSISTGRIKGETAIAKMDFLTRDDSVVAKFFTNKTVLITGGTGFIGKLLVEKLLRACPSLNHIYLVVRDKRGVNAQQRLHKILSEKVFAGVLSRRPEARSQVSAIVGDVQKTQLDLSTEDLNRLKDEVDVVIHSAATVKFNEPLQIAVRTNVGGTANIIELCKTFKKLQSFVHVSTAYVNANQPREPSIEERLYPIDLRPEDILNMVEYMPSSALEAATPHLLGSFPNSYTFTKRLAEDLVVNSGLPAAIVRPSIVVATYKEPFPGWIDNINGPTGFLLALGTGSLTAVRCDVAIRVDLVPADFVVNCILVAAFKRGTRNEDKAVPIVHSCFGRQLSISGFEFQQLATQVVTDQPILSCIRYPKTTICSTQLELRLRMFLFHRLPVELADFLLCRIAGKQLPLRKLYSKLSNGLEVLSFFLNQDWNFERTNLIEMNESLNETDRYLFPLSPPKNFEWIEFLKIYLFSIRYFILKEDLTTVPAARAWWRKLVVIHYASRTLTAFITAKAVASVVELATGVDVPLL